MERLLGVTALEALAVIVATAGMYIAMVLLVRLLGQRILSTMSSFDLAAIIAFGSVMGRAALGTAPRLAGGLIALVTLVLMQALAGLFRLRPFGARVVATRPVLLMAGERVLDDQLRRCHVSTAELSSSLRLAGVGSPSEVAMVIMEPAGGISVLRRGQPIDPALLDDVVGISQLPPELGGPGRPDAPGASAAG